MAKVFTQKPLPETISNLLESKKPDSDFLKECIDNLSKEDTERLIGGYPKCTILMLILCIGETELKHDLINHFIKKEHIGINILDDEGDTVFYYLLGDDKDIYKIMLEREDLDFNIINKTFDNYVKQCILFNDYGGLGILLNDPRTVVTKKHLEMLLEHENVSYNNKSCYECIDICRQRLGDS